MPNNFTKTELENIILDYQNGLRLYQLAEKI